VLLEGRNAVVYGGSGRVGGAVARAFAREGARVFLAARTREPLERVAEEITAAGGRAEASVVDALDPVQVDRHAEEIIARAGSIDVSFSAIGRDDVHGLPLLQMPFEDFVLPVNVAVRALFLTARAAARHMVPTGSGVIMTITAVTAKQAVPEVGGTGVAFDAMESLCRQWAAELGPSGVRVVWLRTTGLPEAIADIPRFPDYGQGRGGMTRDELIQWLTDKTMLRRLTSLAEVGGAAALAASDLAGAITGTGLNVNCGSVVE
jgi:NAD(P)-dependent dehydrogenase (short-subunit alcohol dehydrogenase family)